RSVGIGQSVWRTIMYAKRAAACSCLLGPNLKHLSLESYPMKTTTTLRFMLGQSYLILGALLMPFANVAEAQTVVQPGYTLSTYKAGLSADGNLAGMTIDTSTRTIYFAYQDTTSALWKIAPDAGRTVSSVKPAFANSF